MFEKELSDFFTKREELVYLTGISAEYSMATKTKQKLLTENKSDAVIELEEVMTNMELISNDVFYRRGVSDGIKMLLKMLF